MYKVIAYFTLLFLLTGNTSGEFAPLFVRSIKHNIRTLPAHTSLKEPVVVPVDSDSKPRKPIKIIDDKTGDKVSGSFVKHLPDVANNNKLPPFEENEEPELVEETRLMDGEMVGDAEIVNKVGMVESPDDSEKIKSDRILGGLTAVPGMFPYMASLRTSDMYHICGAAILNKFWLITAAHCGNKYVYAVVGSTSLSSSGQIYTVNQIKFYDFNETTFANDIALVRVSTPIQFSYGRVDSIKLIDYDVADDTYMVFSGWGYINDYGPASNSLQYIYLKQMNIYTCANIMNENPDALPIFYSQVCASSKPKQGACRGDSGGPLVYNGLLVGVDSWGPKPCGTYPDVFTKVKWYSNWIYTVIS